MSIEKSVLVANALVVEAMVKSASGEPSPEVEVAKIANCAVGEEVPRPRRPVAELKLSTEPFGLPKLIVEEAERPLVRRSSVEVEFAAVPKEVVGVNSNATFPAA